MLSLTVPPQRAIMPKAPWRHARGFLARMRDYYEILQVHPKAIPDVIGGVYRVLVRKYHPDLYPPERKAWAERRMAEINVAYEVLSDARKRADYDSGHLRPPLSPEEEAEDAERRGVKCFNHPKTPYVTFCWWCGRPVCEACLDATQAHPRCTTCRDFLADAAAAEPPGVAWPPLERQMGNLGVLAYYGLLGLVAAACFWGAWLLVVGLGGDYAHLTAAFTGLAIAVGYGLFRVATWRVICPACRHANSRVGFRAASPWHAFFAPHLACTTCGRWFLPGELRNAFR